MERGRTDIQSQICERARDEKVKWAVSQAVLWKMAGNGVLGCYGLGMQRQRFWPVAHRKLVETQGGDEIKSILNMAGGLTWENASVSSKYLK